MTTFAKFLATSGIAAFVNICARAILSTFLPFEVAVAIAYLVGMVIAYLLARAFVFAPSGQSARHEFIRFGIVNVVGFAQVWLVSITLANWLFPAIGFDWHPELVAHIVGVASPAVTSYFGHKLFTFRASR